MGKGGENNLHYESHEKSKNGLKNSPKHVQESGSLQKGASAEWPKELNPAQEGPRILIDKIGGSGHTQKNKGKKEGRATEHKECTGALNAIMGIK